MHDDRWLRKLVAFDETLDSGLSSETPGDFDDDIDDGLDSQLFEEARESLLLVERVRGEHPTLFDADATDHVGPTSDLGTIGRFEVIRELGRGGFGIVLLARDPMLDRQVAVKVPLPDVLLSNDLRERFLREGRAAAALRHPNIVPVLEAADRGPIVYLVSEFCDGPSLAEWMAGRDDPVSPRVAAEIVRDIARGVQHAHERGIVHCDLKPGNVLLERTDGSHSDSEIPLPVPRVTDFGMARLVDCEGDRTRTGSVLGTPAYMAPEQAAGNRRLVGPATDVFALGVILHEMLHGRRPFDRDSVLATLHAIQHDEVASDDTPRDERLPHPPESLETIVGRCLAKESHARYPTAGALVEDLQRFLDDEPITPLRVQRSTSRGRSLAIAAMGVLAAIGGWWMLASRGHGSTGQRPQDASIVDGSATDRESAGPDSNPASDVDSLNRRVCAVALSTGASQVFLPKAMLVRPEDVPAEPFTITKVTISDLAPLEDRFVDDLLRLPECRTFGFIQSALTDDQLARFRDRDVESLQLYGTEVTDEGLRALSEMPGLRNLELRSTTFTDAALVHVAEVGELRSLSLLHTSITGEGLAPLVNLPNLRDLRIAWTDIGDDDLISIGRMKLLEHLHLRSNRVTPDGIARLREQLPDCAIQVKDEP